MKKEDYILSDEIKCILSKYYEGISSIEEERKLRKFLSEHDIPESMIVDQTLLSFSNHDDNLDYFANNELWEAIRANESKRLSLKRTILIATSVAASIIILISVGLSFYYTQEKKHSLAVVDTYSNPEEAYRAVQKYLGFASKKLSYAYTEIKPIELLSVPSEAMKPFSEIDKNINRLNALDRINSTSKRLENISVFSNYINVNDKN